MTDRATPTPRACPFVAFEDDRDRRAELPDPRHRCYAEPTPQPRAVAHQAEYCLSPNFSRCPIFLDWAARAAADPIHAMGISYPSVSEATSGPAGPVAASASLAAAAPMPSSAVPDGGLPDPHLPDPTGRDWAAPPPWANDPSYRTSDPRIRASAAVAASPSPAQLDAFPEAAHPDVDYEIGSSGSGVAMATAIPVTPAAPAAPGLNPSASPPPNDYDAGGPSMRIEPMPGASNGEAKAWIEPQPTSIPVVSITAGSADLIEPFLDPSPAPSVAAQPRPANPRRKDGEWQGQPKRRRLASPLGGRGRRIGRFPMLIVVAAMILAVALLLFLLPSLLAGGGAEKTPKPSAVASASHEPTPVPTPTPRGYTVKSGDTMGGIARQFGLTVDQVSCFNAIKDPNRLSVGQVLLIPPDDYACPPKGGGGGRASPTPTR